MKYARWEISSPVGERLLDGALSSDRSLTGLASAAGAGGLAGLAGLAGLL